MKRNVAPFRGGQVLGQSQMNALRNAALATNQAVIGQGEGDSLAPSVVTQVEIVALNTIAPWTLTCRIAGTAGSTFAVAPPPLMYTAGRAGITYTYSDQNTRTANPGAEVQFLTTAYIVGDLLAVQSIAGVLTDINIDARVWAADSP